MPWFKTFLIHSWKTTTLCRIVLTAYHAKAEGADKSQIWLLRAFFFIIDLVLFIPVYFSDRRFNCQFHFTLWRLVVQCLGGVQKLRGQNFGLFWPPSPQRGQNSKQINVAKYISKFLIYGAKMLDKCVKSQKKNFVHCPFLQSQAK